MTDFFKKMEEEREKIEIEEFMNNSVKYNSYSSITKNENLEFLGKKKDSKRKKIDN